MASYKDVTDIGLSEKEIQKKLRTLGKRKKAIYDYLALVSYTPPAPPTIKVTTSAEETLDTIATSFTEDLETLPDRDNGDPLGATGGSEEFGDIKYTTVGTSGPPEVVFPPNIKPIKKDPTKIIKVFDINGGGLEYGGESRTFRIGGDIGAKFELEVIDNHTGYYYNFDNRLFESTRKVLTKILKGGDYSGSINFPTAARVNSFTLNLRAVTDHCGITKHRDYLEVLKEDGTIDYNSSLGSNYDIWKKELIHGTIVYMTVDSIAPTLTDSGEVWNGTTHTAASRVGGNRGARGSLKSNFALTVTCGTNKAIKIDRQPTPSDIFLKSSHAIGAASNDYILDGEDIWSGTARSSGQVVDDSTTGDANVTMDNVVGTSPALWAVGDRVTGNAALDAKTGINAVTITHINVGDNPKTFTMSEAVTIADDETLNFTEPQYFRWPVTNYIGLVDGMLADPNGTYVNAGSRIGAGSTYREVYSEVTDGCETRSITSHEPTGVLIPAITPVGAATSTSLGKITGSAAEIVFNVAQPLAFQSTTHPFYAYGEKLMSKKLGGNVKFTNLKAYIDTGDETTTTVNDANANGVKKLSAVTVTSKNGIMDDISIVSGPGINNLSGDVVVSTIGSGTNVITLTPGDHQLQNGQTLTFDEAALRITITGTLEIDNIGDSSQTFYFDVEKFLTCASNA